MLQRLRYLLRCYCYCNSSSYRLLPSLATVLLVILLHYTAYTTVRSSRTSWNAESSQTGICGTAPNAGIGLHSKCHSPQTGFLWVVMHRVVLLVLNSLPSILAQYQEGRAKKTLRELQQCQSLLQYLWQELQYIPIMGWHTDRACPTPPGMERANQCMEIGDRPMTSTLAAYLAQGSVTGTKSKGAKAAKNPSTCCSSPFIQHTLPRTPFPIVAHEGKAAFLEAEMRAE